jgi:hypothetical protein
MSDEVRAAHSEKMAAPGVREIMSAKARAKRSDLAFCRRHTAAVRAAMAPPEMRQKISAAVLAGMEKARARQLVALTQAWAGATKRVRAKFLAEIVGVVPNGAGGAGHG